MLAISSQPHELELGFTVREHIVEDYLQETIVQPESINFLCENDLDNFELPYFISLELGIQKGK